MSDTKQGYRIYCHFSFRRPKDKPYGIFSIALFADEDATRLMYAKTRAYQLWEDQQFITAIQAYEHALYCIWEKQKDFIEHNVTDIQLVTDNSSLAGWIENPSKNKNYSYYMNRAAYQYKHGGSKEIVINIGLAEVRGHEKSYKYCKEENIANKRPEPKKIETTGMNTVKEIIDKGENIDVRDISEVPDEELFD